MFLTVEFQILRFSGQSARSRHVTARENIRMPGSSPGCARARLASGILGDRSDCGGGGSERRPISSVRQMVDGV